MAEHSVYVATLCELSVERVDDLMSRYMLEETVKTTKTSLNLICFSSYFRNGHLPDTREKVYNVSHHVPVFTECDLTIGVPSGHPCHRGLCRQ